MSINTLRTPRTLSAVAAILLLAAPALQADVLKVPQDFASIQEAVDAATGADTVSLSSGTYTENVIVGVGKDGLQIVGKGRVIVDAHAPEAEGGGSDGFQIGSNNVTLKNITIRHASSVGVRTIGFEGLPTISGLTLDKMQFLNGGDSAIDLTGTGMTVIGCTFWAVGCYGIRIIGDDAVVTRNDIRQLDCTGIFIEGNNASVTNNKISHVNHDEGISVTGDDAMIDKNTIDRADGGGVNVSGNDASVTRNSVNITSDESGIEVNGNNALVDKNKLTAIAGGDGIEVFGTNPTVTNNKVSGVMDGDDGIRVSNDVVEGKGLGSGLIDKNTVTDSLGDGLSISGNGMTISRNKIFDCAVHRDGISLQGDGNTVSQNQVKRVYDDGIVVSGNGNMLIKNKVQECSRDGIKIGNLFEGGGGATDGTILDGNIISNNLSEGVENRGTNTILRRNKISKNRIDVVNATLAGATITIDGDNKIADGSDGTDEPEI